MTAQHFRFKTAPVARMLRASLSFVSILVIVGCTNLFVDSDSSQEPEAGSLTVSTDTALTGSTVEPNLGALDTLAVRWDVSFAYTGPGTAGSLTRAGVNNYSLGDTISGVPYGDWDITVVGYADSGGTQRVAEGTASLTVGPGVNSLTIPISAAMVGNGDVDFTVTFPAAQVDGATVQLDPWPEGGGDVATLAAGTDYNSDFATSGSLAVTTNRPAGEYLLTVQLTDTTVSNGSGDHAPVIELVRVFENLTSSGTVSLAASDLRSPPAVPTGLGVTLGDGTFDLDWTDASNTELGFRVYEGPVDGTAEGSVGPSATTIASASITGAPGAGTAVEYNVVSYNQFGESAAATITFTPLGLGSLFPTGTPGSPTAQNGSVNLGWSTFFGVDTYNLYISQTQADVDSLDPGVRTTNAAAGNAASSYISLTDGTTYYWTVEATNAEGNGTLAAPTAAFTVDSTPPTTPTITGVPPDPTNTQGGNTATFTGDPGVDFVYSLSGATSLGDTTVADAGSDGTETVTLPFLNEGATTLSVVARDSGGNESSPANYSFTVDVTVATPTGVTGGDVTTAPTDYTTIPNPSFSWDAGEAGAEFEYSLDGGTSVEGTTTNTTTTVGPITPGAYDFAVRQVDAASNVSGWSATIPFTYVEPTTVQITISDPTVPNFTIGGGGATLDRTAADVWPLTVSVIGGTITAYDWWLNGTSQATADTYDLAANDPGTVLGANTLTLFVQIDGRWYSTEILFEVVEN